MVTDMDIIFWGNVLANGAFNSLYFVPFMRLIFLRSNVSINVQDYICFTNRLYLLQQNTFVFFQIIYFTMFSSIASTSYKPCCLHIIHPFSSAILKLALEAVDL